MKTLQENTTALICLVFFYTEARVLELDCWDLKLCGSCCFHDGLQEESLLEGSRRSRHALGQWVWNCSSHQISLNHSRVSIIIFIMSSSSSSSCHHVIITLISSSYFMCRPCLASSSTCQLLLGGGTSSPRPPDGWWPESGQWWPQVVMSSVKQCHQERPPSPAVMLHLISHLVGCELTTTLLC